MLRRICWGSRIFSRHPLQSLRRQRSSPSVDRELEAYPTEGTWSRLPSAWPELILIFWLGVVFSPLETAETFFQM